VSGAAQVEKHYVVRFTAGEAFMEKLEQVRSLVWHRLPANASLEQVFELVMDMAIEREDPVARRERRELRAGRSHDRKPPKAATTARRPVESTRHVPAAVRDRVFVRDQGRCTYTAPGGRRCASTKALQIDHIKPVARGGAGTPENLRLLCAYHNRLEAERLRGPHAPRGGP
jgi:5-methylcytosine-specific restriction endonuclease McrA